MSIKMLSETQNKSRVNDLLINAFVILCSNSNVDILIAARVLLSETHDKLRANNTI